MSHHPHTSSEFTRSFLPIAAVLVRVASAATCAAEPISPWPSLVLEERLPRVDAIAIARWGEPSGVAVYDESGNRAVYLRRRLHVTRVLFGKLPRNPDLLVRGGSYFDRNLNSYVVDDVEVVTLLPATTDFIVLLKHLAGSQYELLDGSRGKLRAWDERTATPNTLVMTRRRDLLPAGAVLPMKTPAPDIAAASLSIDQFQELVVRLSQEPSSAHDAERDTGLRFVKNAKFIDRRTIVERLGEAADRFVASRTSGAFLRDHLVREPNSQWIPQPQVSDQRVQIRQPPTWSGVGFAYRLRAFGKTFEPAAFSLGVGLDAKVLVGGNQAPDCRDHPEACTFNVDARQAEAIAREHGLDGGVTRWNSNPYWNASCRAFVWFVQQPSKDDSAHLLLVTTGTGQVCGDRQFVTTIRCGGRLYQRVLAESSSSPPAPVP
jgi:hypothetical protein